MIVSFSRLWCQCCEKSRLHEVICTPACVVCNTPRVFEKEEKVEIERFID